METIQEKIATRYPDLVWEEGAVPVLVVEPARLRPVAERLKNDASLQFDNLVTLVGMDWGDALGVLYCFDSTRFGYRIALKTATTERECPELPSLSDLWPSALLNEREVYDFFGIRFVGHPDMRRLFLRNDWVGYPLRKDYDADPAVNPVSLGSEETEDSTPVFASGSDGETVEGERALFEKDEYVVNIGPQHPATHGVLRFRVSLEGETVRKVDVNCGYIHRGVEKMCESLAYPQTLHMTDRLDYLSAHNNRHGLCLCIEDALGLEVPLRAQYIRTIMDELMRISSHLLFFSTFCMDLGALTAFFYGFRDREFILDMFEETCGARMSMHYNVIGGVAADLHPGFRKRVRDFIAYLPAKLKEYDALFSGNIIARQRMRGIGVLSREDAIAYGVTGPSGRASGWACDVRKLHPYGVYDRVRFDEVLDTAGDVEARYRVRLKEITESLHILEQLIDTIPEGDFAVKTKPVVKLPEGRYFRQVEANRGAFGVYIESRGEKYPYRLKFASPGLPLVSVVDLLARGGKIADLIAVGGSLDYVVPDIDR